MILHLAQKNSVKVSSLTKSLRQSCKSTGSFEKNVLELFFNGSEISNVFSNVYDIFLHFEQSTWLTIIPPNIFVTILLSLISEYISHCLSYQFNIFNSNN